ncbi:MAG: hypothetical protein WEA61_03990 [Anaerolineales bacterium]
MKSAAGYSGTPLIKKLGIKPGQRICILDAPERYGQAIGPLPARVEVLSRLGKLHSLDFIHYFTKQASQLQQMFPKLKSALNWNGSLWISWPKGSSKVPTDVNENLVREIGLAAGLVDVKIAAVDEIWSGLKFVFRREDRPVR